MPAPYNLTAISQSNNIYEFTSGANNLVGGLLGLGMLVGCFVIMFFSFKGFETKKAFAGASFVTAIAAILFRLLSFIGDTPMFACFALAGISLVWLRWDG